MGVAFLVKNFAPEAKGHGAPEVMDAVFNRQGVIRPVVSVVKAFASALSIGSGGSIGREGPIVQRTLVPVATATVTATWIGQLFFGTHPAFSIPAFQTASRVADPLMLLAYATLGLITGLVSALFIRSIYGFESFFEKHVRGGCYV